MKISREFVRDGETVKVVAEHIEGDAWRVHVGDAVLEYTATARSDGGVRLQQTGAQSKAVVAYAVPAAKSLVVRVDGHTHTLEAPAARRGAGGGGGADGTVRAPMTGTLLEVMCKVGDAVAADQTLVVVSAMKMEHKLTAGIVGTVQSVTAVKGATVEQGATLVVVEPNVTK
jgi:acetyl-CoA/propionyl-CoA carboxylase biotin carboxyl carrier protein